MKSLNEEQTAKLTSRLTEMQGNYDKLSLSLAQKDSAINQKTQ